MILKSFSPGSHMGPHPGSHLGTTGTARMGSHMGTTGQVPIWEVLSISRVRSRSIATRRLASQHRHAGCAFVASALAPNCPPRRAPRRAPARAPPCPGEVASNLTSNARAEYMSDAVTKENMTARVYDAGDELWSSGDYLRDDWAPIYREKFPDLSGDEFKGLRFLQQVYSELAKRLLVEFSEKNQGELRDRVRTEVAAQWPDASPEEVEQIIAMTMADIRLEARSA